MSGKPSRNKGGSGEREVCKAIKAAGFEASRARGGTRGDDLVTNLPNTSWEVKRCETLSIPKWVRQAEQQAATDGSTPVLVFRQSNQPWRVVVTLDHYLSLHKGTP